MIKSKSKSNQIQFFSISITILITLISFSLTSELNQNHSPEALNLENGNIKNRKIKGFTEPTIPIRSHSIYAPYVDSDLQNRWFDFGGSTIIDTNKHIRLTQDRSSQAGYLWSRQSISQTNFQIEIEFKIDGKSSTVFGDGMAIWLTQSSTHIGPVFGAADHWTGLGIFIDTFPNSRHSYSFPRIIGMSNNGYMSYDVGKDGDGQESGSCSFSIRRADVATKLRITYVQSKFLEVLIHHEKWDEWNHCFTLDDFHLPEKPILGFTAHTGEVSDAHDIVSVSSTGIVYHSPEDLSAKKKSSAWNHHQDDRLGGGIGSGGMGLGGKILTIFAWIIKWGTLLGLLGLAGFGAKKYFNKYQKESLKRF
ncbi:legume-like lectin family-domain-containing protein [Melampsora americana]|nr:legume-like lectin family-domain-containing protein [Melampsora americana]